MTRFSLSSLFQRTMIATAALCVSFAASAAPSPDATTFKFGKLGSAPCGAEPEAEATEPQVPPAAWCSPAAEEEDWSYLLATASPGDTMTRQGPEVAISRLNPEFVTRLASAIRDARESGLPSAGIFSAYRPPGFGVGGFGDKFRSLHSYGLAVDMTGIGEPGTNEAKLWHEIAERHEIFCPYGFNSRTEWNHCQATPIKSVPADSPLRKTITAAGPIELEKMFKVGRAVIDFVAGAVSVAAASVRLIEPEAAKHNLVRALASASEHLDGRPVHEARNHPHETLARATRRDKTRLLALATDAQHSEKSHRKLALDTKTHESRKGGRAAESHRDSTRRHSHLA